MMWQPTRPARCENGSSFAFVASLEPCQLSCHPPACAVQHRRMSEDEIATRKHTRQRSGCCKARHIRPGRAVSLITLLPGQQQDRRPR